MSKDQEPAKGREIVRETPEEPQSQFVTMTHPDGSGETTIVDRNSFEELYRHQGWEVVSSNTTQAATTSATAADTITE
jgi:hypothetical protein